MVTNASYSVCEYPSVREIHQATIRAHHAKAGYDYPTIHLPPTLSPLIGLPTRIYETVHNGALAFLVVVSPNAAKRENAILSPKPSPSHGGGRRFKSGRAHWFSIL
ncbi:MAG: hypothetical protein ABSB81_11535 [Halobacteriota archaeon]